MDLVARATRRDVLGVLLCPNQVPVFPGCHRSFYALLIGDGPTFYSCALEGNR